MLWKAANCSHLPRKGRPCPTLGVALQNLGRPFTCACHLREGISLLSSAVSTNCLGGRQYLTGEPQPPSIGQFLLITGEKHTFGVPLLTGFNPSVASYVP